MRKCGDDVDVFILELHSRIANIQHIQKLGFTVENLSNMFEKESKKDIIANIKNIANNAEYIELLLNLQLFKPSNVSSIFQSKYHIGTSIKALYQAIAKNPEKLAKILTYKNIFFQNHSQLLLFLTTLIKTSQCSMESAMEQIFNNFATLINTLQELKANPIRAHYGLSEWYEIKQAITKNIQYIL